MDWQVAAVTQENLVGFQGGALIADSTSGEVSHVVLLKSCNHFCDATEVLDWGAER